MTKQKQEQQTMQCDQQIATYGRSSPYPTKTATPLVRQGPKNLTAHLLCRLGQLHIAQTAVYFNYRRYILLWTPAL